MNRVTLTHRSFFFLGIKLAQFDWVRYLFLAFTKTVMSAAMLYESIWYDRPKYEQAEAHYQRSLAGTLSVSQSHGSPVKVLDIKIFMFSTANLYFIWTIFLHVLYMVFEIELRC